MNKLQELQKITASIDGWLTPREGEFLYNAAKKCPKGTVIVEIGSWKGKSTIWLGSGSKEGNRAVIYAIDPHTGSSEHRKSFGKVWTFGKFKKNIKKAGIADVVVPVVKTSEAAAKDWKKKVGFLWIDGAHEYEMVLLDYKLWEPHLVNGGVIAFHDSQTKGPRRVVKKHLYCGSKFKNVGFIEGVTYATKVGRITAADKARNLYAFLLTTVYSLAGRVPLPKFVKVIGNKMAKIFQAN